MRREREELIDHLLGELSPERSREVAERIAADPEIARERDHLREAMRLIRTAAAEGWEAQAGRGRLVRLRPAVAAAAIILAVVLGIFLSNGGPHANTIYDPDGAFGYARAEEVDAAGRVHTPSTGTSCALRQGNAVIAAIGGGPKYPLRVGEAIPFDSDINVNAEGGARIDLPHGGILFLDPFAEVRIRQHQDGGVALRLLDGAAIAVAGERALHLAVHGTDLLMRQESGATLLRKRPAEAIPLRGDLFLLLDHGKRFRVPESERLPAACANEPATTAVRDDELELDWYRALVYEPGCRVEDLTLDDDGRSKELAVDDDTLLYLRVVPTDSTTLRIAFGGAAREFSLIRGIPLRVRLKLADLGPGPRLSITPPKDVREVRIFAATPRR